MEKVNGKDHDILVGLNVKVDRLISDVKEVKDGTNQQLMDHERRIETLESINNKYPANVLVPEFLELKQKFHDQTLTAKERLRLTVIISSVITFVLTTIGAIIGIVTGVIRLRG